MKIIVIANVVSISGMHQRLEAIKRLVSSRLVKLPQFYSDMQVFTVFNSDHCEGFHFKSIQQWTHVINADG